LFHWKADSLSKAPMSRDLHSHQAVIDSLIAEGVPPHIVYAFRKTGMLVTTQMYKCLPEVDQRRWDNALREFETLEWDAEKNPPQ
jgi:hypothetical protein